MRLLDSVCILLLYVLNAMLVPAQQVSGVRPVQEGRDIRIFYTSVAVEIQASDSKEVGVI